MKTFDRDRKINFVDEANVFVGFDNEASCCEQFGWFVSRSIPTKIGEGAEEVDTDGFNFDTAFFREITPEEEYFDQGGMAIFRLAKGDEELFLTLHNSHNGYYAHGFQMEVGGVRIHDGAL